MKHPFSLLLSAAVLLIVISCKDDNKPATTSSTNPACDSNYRVVYEADGYIVLSKKEKPSKFTDPIDPAKAVDMISEYVGPDVNRSTGKLEDNMFKYTTFSVSKLIEYLDAYPSGEMPDSLRLYAGKYNSGNLPAGNYDDYLNRQTLLIVGVKSGQERYDPTKTYLNPVNIGTLCPPRCNKDDFSDQNAGAIYLKKGAAKAGATNW